MATLPVDASVYVYMSNSKYPLIFKVGYDSLERFHYWSSGTRFKSLRKLHRFCSAHGNIWKVEVKHYKTFDTPLLTLTSGEFQRSKLPVRPARI